jgi:hypothetical protein
MLGFAARVLLLFFQQAAVPEPPKPPPEAPAQAKRTELNLLGSTDSAAGESRRNENVQFNLIDNNALKYLNIRLGTNATLVTEFRPERKYFGTEFGNAPAGVIHLTTRKSADTFHGGVSLTRSDSIFSARSFFQAGDVQPAHENDYGIVAAFRGWSGAHLTVEGSQQTLRGSVNGNVLVPLASERTPLASDLGVRSLVQRWIDAYPKALPNRTDVDPRALNTNSPQSIDTEASNIRLDQNAGVRDRIFAQHAFTNQKVDAFQFVAGQNPDTNTKSHTARVTWDHRFDDHSLLDFTFGFDRIHSLLTPEPNAVGPQVVVGTAYQSLGPGAIIPIDRRLTRFREAAIFRRTAGNHQLSVGGELDRVRNNGLESSSERGNYYFRSDFGRDAITNFRLGVASRYSAAIGNGHRGFRWFEQQFFAGDEWKARSNLVLNYGLRYSPVTGPNEVNGLTPVNFQCDCTTFGPQFGIAWQTHGMGLIRAGYGLHFGDIYPQTLQQVRWDPPNFLKVEVQAPASILTPLENTYLGPGARHLAFDVPPDLKAPYSHQYTFLWEPFQSKPWSIQLGYIGSRSHKLFMMWFANRAVPIPGVPQTTATIPDRRPDPRYYEFREARNASNAYFDAARVTFRAPAWHGLTSEASYWFSKAIDTGSAYTNMAAGDEALQGYSQSQDLVAQDLKGPSSFDQSHAVMVRFQYAPPELVSAARMLRGAVNGWRISGTFLAKTGLPFTVITGSDGPGFGNVDGSNGDRPNLIDPSVLGRTFGDPNTSSALLPRTAFSFIAPTESRGNLGSNTFRRGGIRNMNAALARTWAVHGDWRATVRAESINFFNTPQFASPSADLSSPAFGKITNTLNDGRSFQFTLQIQF